MNDREKHLLGLIFKENPTATPEAMKISSNGKAVPLNEIREVYNSVRPSFLIKLVRKLRSYFCR